MSKAPKIAARATPRRRVSVDSTAAADAADSTLDNVEDDAEDEEQVEVFVKKAFKFTTDDHVLHDIPAGTQDVPRSWLEHSYFKAHGVAETEKRKTAK